MPTLPNQIKVADRIVKFKGGYRQQFFNTKNVVWLDLNHFQLELSPNTTADLTDMTGYWMNARCICDAKVTVTAGGKTDILVDGRFFNVRHELFSYGRKFSIIYYDVKPDSTVQASKN
jgi:hypothetical protein